MKRRLRRERPGIDINTTSLVDVAFCLLIVFVIVTPVLQGGIALNLPESEAAATEVQQNSVLISIDRNGLVYAGESTSPTRDVKGAVAILSKGDRKANIEVRADEAADYGVVLKTLGELNAAGYTQLNLLSETSSKQSQ